MQCLCDLREVHIALPDHLLALLELDAADILTGGNGQMLVKQGCQITGAYIGLSGHQGHRQLLLHMGADVLLSPANHLIFCMNGIL